MVTREQCLRMWLTRWATLRAWGKDLSHFKLDVVDRAYADRSGTCWPTKGRIAIYLSPHLTHDLDCLIHELAHGAVAGDEHHGSRWQEAYAMGIMEVTGIIVPRAAHNYEVLCRVGESAMRTWWRISGNERLWKLARAS